VDGLLGMREITEARADEQAEERRRDGHADPEPAIAKARRPALLAHRREIDGLGLAARGGDQPLRYRLVQRLIAGGAQQRRALAQAPREVAQLRIALELERHRVALALIELAVEIGDQPFVTRPWHRLYSSA